MAKATFTAPAITCEGCAGSIKRSLGKLAGVESVEVEIPTKKVEVEFDPAATSEENIRQRLELAGFPASE